MSLLNTIDPWDEVTLLEVAKIVSRNAKRPKIKPEDKLALEGYLFSLNGRARERALKYITNNLKHKIEII